MDIKDIEKLEKTFKNYFCEHCDFICSQKIDWDRHILRPKHLKNVIWIPKIPEKLEKTFLCDCGKIFKTNGGLWKHKKICSTIKPKITDDYNSLNEKEIIMSLLQQNNQLQNQIIELCKEKSITNINNSGTHINSHNKAFNLNFFLNETCKDAMNIMDFVDSIKLQLSDLENVGKLGYVEGITNIITKNLNALDVTQRPIHCADKKREVIYIKDEDKWEKEDEQKKKIRKAIKRVACKNQRLIPQFKEKHPDCLKASSNFSDQYNKIIVESMGGSGDNDNEKEEKIIRNISKQVLIDK
jgi:hypothetical protein